MKRIFLITLLCFQFIAMFAQPGSRKGNRIESLKIAHISGRLNLDPKTAEQFWPLYHQYENELQQVVLEKRRMNQNEQRSAEDILDQEQKALDIKRKYSQQFLRVIDNNQLNQLVQAEKEFRQMIIRKASRTDDETPNRFRKSMDNNNPTFDRPQRLERKRMMESQPTQQSPRMQPSRSTTPARESQRMQETPSRPTRQFPNR